MVKLCSQLLLLASLLSLAVSVPSELGSSALEARAPPTCTVSTVMPPPPGYVCGAQGSVRRPSVLTSTTTATQSACRDLCLNTANCISFSYGAGRRCITYNAKILDSSFTRSATGRAFWNRHCYKKTCACPQGQTNCGGNCVDKQSDSNNCGACGNVCGNGASCSSGACTCSAGSALCSGPNGPCQDTTSDPNNCGSCGNTCGDGASCTDSSCTCPSGYALCSGPNGPCQGTTSDHNNCGSCGNTCGDGASCTDSSCTCPSGSGLCSGPNGPCQDLTSDNNNCGSCGNTCGDGATCSSGTCTCPTGQSPCPGPNGPCTDITSNNNNCGGCGNTCDTSPGCYHGICANCSGDFCAQSADTPCGTAGNCNCVGIEGSQTFGVCSDINDGSSCQGTFTTACSTTADCPDGSFCGSYQDACNCGRNACFPSSNRCSNPQAASRIFAVRPAVANPGGKTAKGH